MLTDRITAMLPNGSASGRLLPTWQRVVVNSVLILGIVAMHNALAGDSNSSGEHHGTSMTPSMAVAAQHITVGDPKFAPLNDPGIPPTSPMPDCGGAMALCLAMILGISAAIMIRKRLSERVLWRLSPAAAFALVAPRWPFGSLSPLQHSSILRC